MKPPFTFTSQKPTEPGWYWCRNEGEEQGEIWEAVVRVDKQPDGSLICAWMAKPGTLHTLASDLWSDSSEWAGPIEPPSRAVSSSPFNEDYFMRGPDTGLSNYRDYRWRPELTIPACAQIMAFLGAKKGDTVLDYGCARGYYVRALRELHYNAFGQDVSTWAIENCDPDVKAFVSNENVIGVFHWILCKDVLEHIPPDVLNVVIEYFLKIVLRSVFIVVPLVAYSENEAYINPADNADATHVNRWTLTEWLDFIQYIIGNRSSTFTVSGSYKVHGVKQAADPYPRSCGFITIRRHE